jgi:protein-S-isoprenylcysteine O-methyltransferase Ste14
MESSLKTSAIELDITGGERVVLISIFIGIWVLPIVYLATGWLDRLDYHMPAGMSLLGAGFFLMSLWLRYRSQKDLDRNWSPSLVIWEGHQLVTEGVYTYIRHPLYASLGLWGIAQPLLLHNWAAGWAGLFAVGLVYIVRLPREEAMLESHFGESYTRYRQQTGAIIPRRMKRDRD